MIWQNAWAFVGLLALAVPLAIHLLGRRTARVRRFPSLRFVAASNPLSTRRTRPTDIRLLIARLGILIVAVGALARPLFVTADRERALGRALARAIIVDTSASMRRPARGGGSVERARDAARRRAGELAGPATSSAIVETAAPADAIAGAVAWLATKPARREIIIVSDFQTNTLDRIDLDSVPSGVGVEVVRIDVAPDAGDVEAPATSGEPVILAGSADRAGAEAARGAALSIVASRPAPDRPLAVVYRRFDGRVELLRDAKPIDAPWQGDVLAALRADSNLAAVARAARIVPDSAFDGANRGAFTIVAPSSSGAPLILGARGTIAGRDRLLLFFQGDAGSLASAALIAASIEAASTAAPAAEMEPATIAETTLAEWRRPAARVTMMEASTESGESDGRWFWIAALLLLAIETWMRRPRREVPAVERVHERAA